MRKLKCQWRLDMCVRQTRRDTLYKMLKNRHGGHVPCFVCKNPVDKDDATLEHIYPRSKGGTDDLNNLSISHTKCNHDRGNDEEGSSDNYKR